MSGGESLRSVSRCLRSRLGYSGIRVGDLLGTGGKGSTPSGERTRLTLLAQARGRISGKPLGEFAPGFGSRTRAVRVLALILQCLDALVDFGRVDRRLRPRVDGADRELRPNLPFDP